MPYQECGCHLKYANRETGKQRRDERMEEGKREGNKGNKEERVKGREEKQNEG